MVEFLDMSRGSICSLEKNNFFGSNLIYFNLIDFFNLILDFWIIVGYDDIHSALMPVLLLKIRDR